MDRRVIDLNCDLGEIAGSPVDAAVMPLITSANIACGGHAGDAETMRRTLRLARDAGVSAGAHPGWPDREGFGRRTLSMTPREVEAVVCDQIAALARIASAEGVRLRHVKAHGALYTAAARDAAIAAALAGAVRDADPSLVLFGAAGSEMLRAGAAAGLAVAAEAFADRGYEADGSLTPRAMPGAVIDDPGVVASRAVRLATEGRIEASGGIEIVIRPDTLCVHGDTPRAVELARAVRAALERAGLILAPAAGRSHPLG
ncbi:MAG: 5-oxoprolinase subunit PxpA [Acidobacteriota bacterium]